MLCTSFTVGAETRDSGGWANGKGWCCHGRARMEAIRAAMEAADSHEDTPFRIYFRLELCRESCFYGDCMDMMVIFPQALSIADRYPDTPSTCFDSGYLDAMDHILWVYKWVVEECRSFYQVMRRNSNTCPPHRIQLMVEIFMTIFIFDSAATPAGIISSEFKHNMPPYVISVKILGISNFQTWFLYLLH